MLNYIGSDEAGRSLPDRQALDDVFSLVYEELRQVASWVRGREPSQTLNSTALVNEAWLKLKESPRLAGTSAAHFKAIAARAMRQVLVDAARKRHAQKRDAGVAAPLIEAERAGKASRFDVELLALDTALETLEGLNPRQARVVDCRFFLGMSVPETADLLGVSESLIERDWRAAKAWLASTIEAYPQH
jgi:RNA polymerase sigma factor (TIGR02999 family)